jgi:hypothetical protein
MAKQGAEMQFSRTLQLTSDAEMTIRFRSSRPGGSRVVQGLSILLSAGVILLLGRLVSAKKI